MYIKKQKKTKKKSKKKEDHRRRKSTWDGTSTYTCQEKRRNKHKDKIGYSKIKLIVSSNIPVLAPAQSR